MLSNPSIFIYEREDSGKVIDIFASKIIIVLDPYIVCNYGFDECEIISLKDYETKYTFSITDSDGYTKEGMIRKMKEELEDWLWPNPEEVLEEPSN